MANSKGVEKTQSSIEFITTYGWAILIVAIAMVVFISLGLYNPAQENFCLSKTGYSCSNITMNSSGSVAVALAQGIATQNNKIVITGTGCSNSTSQPSSYTNTNKTVYRGQSSKIVFTCPIVNAARIGTPFKGTLWIVYSQGNTTGIISQIGSVSTSVTTTGGVGNPVPLPAGAQAEINNATSFGFNINGTVLQASSQSFCVLQQIDYCNNNKLGQYICINSGYSAEMHSQYQSIYSNDQDFCSSVYNPGTLYCTYVGGYCVINATGTNPPPPG